MENKNIVGKALFAGMVMAIILTSCTTARNATRKHDRMVKNFPFVHQGGTTITERDTVIMTKEKVIQGETIFEKCPEAGDTLKKVETKEDGTTIETQLIGNDDGTKTLKTTVTIPKEKIVVKIKEKTIKIFEDNTFFEDLKWLTIGTCIGIVLTFCLTWFVLFRNRKK